MVCVMVIVCVIGIVCERYSVCDRDSVCERVCVCVCVCVCVTALSNYDVDSLRARTLSRSMLFFPGITCGVRTWLRSRSISESRGR